MTRYISVNILFSCFLVYNIVTFTVYVVVVERDSTVWILDSNLFVVTHSSGESLRAML